MASEARKAIRLLNLSSPERRFPGEAEVIIGQTSRPLFGNAFPPFIVIPFPTPLAACE